MNKEEKELVEGIKQYPTHRELCLIHVIERLDEELNNRNKRIHKLEKNIEFIINKIVNKAKEYRYHTEITAGTNIETNIRQQTLTELLEEIEKEI